MQRTPVWAIAELPEVLMSVKVSTSACREHPCGDGDVLITDFAVRQSQPLHAENTRVGERRGMSRGKQAGKSQPLHAENTRVGYRI